MTPTEALTRLRSGHAEAGAPRTRLLRPLKDGFKVCYTNWISPNLLASRFWPRFGFQDAAYRLAKKVNPMIAWAKDE